MTNQYAPYALRHVGNSWRITKNGEYVFSFKSKAKALAYIKKVLNNEKASSAAVNISVRSRS